jgi:hypothetical protein
MNPSSAKPEIANVNNIARHNNMKHTSVKPEIVIVNKIANHSNMK